MHQSDLISYSENFNNNIKASQILFDNSSKSLSLDKYRIKVFNDLYIDSNNIAIPGQVHSNEIKWVEEAGFFPNTDGIITNNNDIILSLQTADCLPIFIFDYKNNIKGLVHSGWKGTKDKIIVNALSLMFSKGSSPKDIAIVIGKSIHKCCYQIGEELINYFDKDCISFDGNKFFLSLQEQILNDLRKLDILKKYIYIDNQCTFMNNQLSSYRRDGVEAGRMISLLGNY